MKILGNGVSAAWHSLRNLHSGARFPIFLSYAVTFRCTHRCSYCALPPAGPELSFEEFRPLLDGFREMGLVRLGLTGGEPLLHPDIGRIIQRCADIGVVTVLSTNGALVKTRIDEIDRLDVASISLDGDAEVQDDLRGRGSFRAALEAIDLLRGRGVGVVLSAVLSAGNIRHLDEVLEIAEQKGVATVWQPYFPSIGEDTPQDPNRPDAARFHEAVSRLISMKLRRPGRIASSLPYLRFIRDHYPRYDTSSCLAGELFFALSPDGQLHPCYPFVGRRDGIPVTPQTLRQVVETFESPRCTTPCFCNGHIENRFLLRLHPLAVFDALSSVLRFKLGAGPGG